MEAAAVMFFMTLFGLIVVQMTTWPLTINALLAFLVSFISLYFAIVNTSLLPIEHILLSLYNKNGLSTNKKSTIEAAPQSGLPETSLAIFDDEITKKLRELTGNIVKDFILDWYNTVSDDVQFVQQAFELFEHIFVEIRARVTRVDSQVFAQLLLRHLLRHHTCFKEAQRCAGRHGANDPDRLQQLTVVAYEKLHGHLAMSNLPDTEIDHLRSLVAVLLKALLPRNFVLSGTSLYLIRELIACNVLFPFIDLLSSPLWLNGAVVTVLESEQEQQDADNDEDASSNATSSDSDSVEVTLDQQSSFAFSPDHEMSGFVSADYVADDADAPPQSPSARFSTTNNNNASGESVLLDIPTVRCGEIGDPDALSSTSPDSSLIDSFLSLPNGARQGHFSDCGELTPPSRPSSPTVSPEGESTTAPQSSSSGLGQHFQRGGFFSPKFDEAEQKKKSLLDQRIFRHVRIPEAVTMEEAFDSGNKYTMYRITYSAVASPPAQKKTFLKAFSRAKDEQPTGEGSDLKSFQVQRRFREFLTLQDRLGENPSLRKIAQGVRGPSRMFPMPIGNRDKEYIQKRRLFLQAYLRELCSHVPICQSAEMKEFLAFNSDPRLAYVRRPSDVIPRFDKMLKNALQEFLGSASLKIADTFSSDNDGDFYVPSPPPTSTDQHLNHSKSMPQLPPVGEAPGTGDATLTSRAPSTTLTSRVPSMTHTIPAMKITPAAIGPVKKLKNLVLGRASAPSVLQDAYRDFTPFNGPRNANHVTFGRPWRTPDNLLACRNTFRAHWSTPARRTQGDGCDRMENQADVDANFLGEFSVAGKLFRLTKRIWGLELGVNTLSFLAVGRFATHYLNVHLQELTVKEKWMKYLSALQDALWPKGEWKKTRADEEDTNPEKVLEAAREALGSALPDALPLLVGQTHFKSGVAEVLESFSNQTINRHLVYHLLDTATRQLFPDLQTVLSHRSNIAL